MLRSHPIDRPKSDLNRLLTRLVIAAFPTLGLAACFGGQPTEYEMKIAAEAALGGLARERSQFTTGRQSVEYIKTISCEESKEDPGYLCKFAFRQGVLFLETKGRFYRDRAGQVKFDGSRPVKADSKK